jgi:hypothetical protein
VRIHNYLGRGEHLLAERLPAGVRGPAHNPAEGRRRGRVPGAEPRSRRKDEDRYLAFVRQSAQDTLSQTIIAGTFAWGSVL